MLNFHDLPTSATKLRFCDLLEVLLLFLARIGHSSPIYEFIGQNQRMPSNFHMVKNHKNKLENDAHLEAILPRLAPTLAKTLVHENQTEERVAFWLIYNILLINNIFN